MRTEHRQWLRDTGLLGSEEAARNYALQGAEPLVARMYPQVPYECLLLAADAMGLAVFIDDYCSRSAHPERTRALIDAFITLTHGELTHGKLDEESFSGGPLRRGWLDVWDRTAHAMSRSWQEQALRSWHDLFRAWAEEAEARAADNPPRLDAFFGLRRRGIGVRPFLDIAESGSGMELPAHVRNHPCVQELVVLCTDLCIFVNDAHSLERELAAGEQNNLVMVLVRAHDWPVPRALDELRRMFDRSCRRLLRLATEGIADLSLSLRLSGDEAAQLAQYVDLIQSFVRGNYDWSLESARYQERGYAKTPRALYLDVLDARWPRPACRSDPSTMGTRADTPRRSSPLWYILWHP
ncbi:hypothetical protein ACH4PU_35815 [Streptomyces sp. NPDC021100]|uniref:terpene synthase family protein n=1 Tax=Streptomyces sp. NPDC021100 TaxID=3365114 RepID=UPI00379A4CFE